MSRTVKSRYSDRKLRRLRKSWLKSGKTNNEIKHLAMNYSHEKHAKKQRQHEEYFSPSSVNNDVTNTARHKRKRISSSTSE